MIGAVVGVQPFGGEGKSGTGPKAGGPLYLPRLQRPSGATPSGHSIAAAAGPENPALHALIAWAKAHDCRQLAALAEGYARDPLLNTVLPLPGPTGERNTLSFAPRGNVLCSAACTGTLLNQIAAVFASGNHVVVSAASLALMPSGLPQSLLDAVRCVEQIGLGDLHAALVETPQLLVALAARDGALVPVIETAETSAIPLSRLVTERAVCINTTAAGGNASLMTLENRLSEPDYSRL
jgi:RHH-type proline utilization regulon transcriptional repressor/proline dehydrogenase/delta 1-pyrroline-5-carboxylate dehydrogenase